MASTLISPWIVCLDPVAQITPPGDLAKALRFRYSRETWLRHLRERKAKDEHDEDSGEHGQELDSKTRKRKASSLQQVKDTLCREIWTNLKVETSSKDKDKKHNASNQKHRKVCSPPDLHVPKLDLDDLSRRILRKATSTCEALKAQEEARLSKEEHEAKELKERETRKHKRSSLSGGGSPYGSGTQVGENESDLEELALELRDAAAKASAWLVGGPEVAFVPEPQFRHSTDPPRHAFSLPPVNLWVETQKGPQSPLAKIREKMNTLIKGYRTKKLHIKLKSKLATKILEQSTPLTQVYTIQGPPGCGKTTLLRALAQELGMKCTTLSGFQDEDMFTAIRNLLFSGTLGEAVTGTRTATETGPGTGLAIGNGIGNVTAAEAPLSSSSAIANGQFILIKDFESGFYSSTRGQITFPQFSEFLQPFLRPSLSQTPRLWPISVIFFLTPDAYQGKSGKKKVGTLVKKMQEHGDRGIELSFYAPWPNQVWSILPNWKHVTLHIVKMLDIFNATRSLREFVCLPLPLSLPLPGDQPKLENEQLRGQFAKASREWTRLLDEVSTYVTEKLFLCDPSRALPDLVECVEKGDMRRLVNFLRFSICTKASVSRIYQFVKIWASATSLQEMTQAIREFLQVSEAISKTKTQEFQEKSGKEQKRSQGEKREKEKEEKEDAFPGLQKMRRLSNVSVLKAASASARARKTPKLKSLDQWKLADRCWGESTTFVEDVMSGQISGKTPQTASSALDFLFHGAPTLASPLNFPREATSGASELQELDLVAAIADDFSVGDMMDTFNTSTLASVADTMDFRSELTPAMEVLSNVSNKLAIFRVNHFTFKTPQSQSQSQSQSQTHSKGGVSKSGGKRPWVPYQQRPKRNWTRIGDWRGETRKNFNKAYIQQYCTPILALSQEFGTIPVELLPESHTAHILETRGLAPDVMGSPWSSVKPNVHLSIWACLQYARSILRKWDSLKEMEDEMPITVLTSPLYKGKARHQRAQHKQLSAELNSFSQMLTLLRKLNTPWEVEENKLRVDGELMWLPSGAAVPIYPQTAVSGKLLALHYPALHAVAEKYKSRRTKPNQRERKTKNGTAPGEEDGNAKSDGEEEGEEESYVKYPIIPTNDPLIPLQFQQHAKLYGMDERHDQAEHHGLLNGTIRESDPHWYPPAAPPPPPRPANPLKQLENERKYRNGELGHKSLLSRPFRPLQSSPLTLTGSATPAAAVVIKPEMKLKLSRQEAMELTTRLEALLKRS